MHAQILLGVRWCAISVFLFLKFYNFIKGIMRIHSIFKKPKINVFIPHLLRLATEQCVASNVWKKNCPNFFIYTVKSSKKVGVIILPFIPGSFFLISNATNFFIRSLTGLFWKKKKSYYTLLVFFNRVPYMQLLQMIPGVNIICRKVSVESVNGVGGSGGSLRPQRGP